jgi:hypothetical protein
VAQRADRTPTLTLWASEDLPVTDKTIPVDVEWALQGKTLGRAGSRVLACSNGELSMENFTELIGRFSLGTPDKLPQVSVSYLTSGTRPGREYYLGMAIHDWAADVQTDGGELLERDDDNRPVAVTTYFCVPYQPLADAGVSYQAMYREFRSIRLTTTSGPRLRVEFPVRTGLPAINALAMQSAGRLLTGRPVCVLGADSATMAERLEFIGAVAALLPYGFRTRLAAASWVRPTHRDHRFRLCFSAAKRDANPPDDLVYWGFPERTALTPDDDYAYAYDRWLAETVGKLENLARLTKPRSFNREEVFESLDEIGFPHSEPDKIRSRRPEPDKSEPDEPEPQPPSPLTTVKGANFDVDQLLRDCADSIQPVQVPGLNTAITRLKARPRSTVSHEERVRYQEFIKEHHLFRHDEALGGYEPKLREALLNVAFSPPLSYADYCVIEDSLLPGFPDETLLRKIADMEMSDWLIRAVVYGQLPVKERIKKLIDWHKTAKVTPDELISTAAGKWNRPYHAHFAIVMTADLMTRVKWDYLLVRSVLQRHSYLARPLQIAGYGYGKDDAQVETLKIFLNTAYPGGLGERDIRQILLEAAEPPSPALLAAILIQLASQEDAQLAREAYVSRMTLAMNLKPETLEVLKSRLPFANGRRSGSAAETSPYPVTDRT